MLIIKRNKYFEFNSNNVIDMSYMLLGCTNDLKMKIIKKNKDIKDKAFD